MKTFSKLTALSLLLANIQFGHCQMQAFSSKNYKRLPSAQATHIWEHGQVFPQGGSPMVSVSKRRIDGLVDFFEGRVGARPELEKARDRNFDVLMAPYKVNKQCAISWSAWMIGEIGSSTFRGAVELNVFVPPYSLKNHQPKRAVVYLPNKQQELGKPSVTMASETIITILPHQRSRESSVLYSGLAQITLYFDKALFRELIAGTSAKVVFGPIGIELSSIDMTYLSRFWQKVEQSEGNARPDAPPPARKPNIEPQADLNSESEVNSNAEDDVQADE